MEKCIDSENTISFIKQDDLDSQPSKSFRNTHNIPYYIESDCIYHDYPFNSIKINGKSKICSIAVFRKNRLFPNTIDELKNQTLTTDLIKKKLFIEIKIPLSKSIKIYICGQDLPMHFLQISDKPNVVKVQFEENQYSIICYKQFLEYKLKNPHFEDLFSLEIIRFCLRQKKFTFEPINDFSIKFKAPCTKKKRSSLIIIEIKNQVLKISNKFDFNLDQRQEISKFEIIKQLSFINSIVKYGKFVFKPELSFNTSYFVKGNLSLLFNTFEEVEKINISIQKYVKSIECSLTAKNFKLTEQKLKEEKKIVYQLYSKNNSLYFINRFKCNLIQFNEKEISVCYHKFLNTETLESYVDSYDFEILGYIIELIKKLASIYLFFKNLFFPLQHFVFYEERIVCLFNCPLSNILEYRLCLKEEASLKEKETIKNLKIGLQQLHSDYLKSITRIHKTDDFLKLRHSDSFQEKIEYAEIAKKRSVLSLNNRCTPTLKFYGIFYTNRGIYVYYSNRVKETFVDILRRSSIKELKVMIQMVFYLIEKVLIRSSSIKAFDFDCLVISQKGNLKLIPKSEEEVSQEFFAPEVTKGRASNKSLIYSFGVTAKYICSSVHHKFNGNWKDFTEVPEEVSDLMPKISRIIHSCCIPNIVSRISIVALKELILSV